LITFTTPLLRHFSVATQSTFLAVLDAPYQYAVE
jgi:hypothetical protein